MRYFAKSWYAQRHYCWRHLWWAITVSSYFSTDVFVSFLFHLSHIWTKNVSFIRKRIYDYKILQPAVLCFTTAADDNLVMSPNDDPLRCRHRSQIFVFGNTEMDVLTDTWGWRWTAGGFKMTFEQIRWLTKSLPRWGDARTTGRQTQVSAWK